jgi:hypothetical protein
MSEWVGGCMQGATKQGPAGARAWS